MRALGVIAGMVLVALGSVLFMRAAMPDLWLQLMQELPQRLAGVIQTDPDAEQPHAKPPVTPSLLEGPDAGSPPGPTVPARLADAGERTDGQALQTEPDEPAQRIVAAAAKPPDAMVPAGSEASGDATPGSLNLLDDSGTAAGRAAREPLPNPKAAGLADASPSLSSAAPQAPGENKLPGAATTPTAWHTFWKPFRTERSATGFASHVSQETGLPIEIKRTPRGEYAVGFSYADDLELERKIALIEALTGLRVFAETQQ